MDRISDHKGRLQEETPRSKPGRASGVFKARLPRAHLPSSVVLGKRDAHSRPPTPERYIRPQTVEKVECDAAGLHPTASTTANRATNRAIHHIGP